MQTKLSTIRITGIVMSLVMAVLVILPFLHVRINVLINWITVAYMAGFLFTHNSRYQELCHNKGWAKANRIIAFIMYMVTVALLVLFILSEYVGVDGVVAFFNKINQLV